MDFKEFKEKYFGKSVVDIVKDLMLETDFWKNDKSMVELCLDIDKLIETIIQLDKTHPSIYSFQKRIIILKYILETFTVLESFPELDTFDDFDVSVEEAIYTVSSQARFINQMVNDGLQELRNIVLEDLYNIMKDGIPNEKELQELTQSLENMFKNESPEKLGLIKDILDFNDPSLKQIKEQVYNNNDMNKLQRDVMTQIVNTSKKESKETK